MHKSPQGTQLEVQEEEEGEEKSKRRNMKGLPVRQALKNTDFLSAKHKTLIFHLELY